MMNSERRHPCLRYVSSPMCPGRTTGEWSDLRDLNRAAVSKTASVRVQFLPPPAISEEDALCRQDRPRWDNMDLFECCDEKTCRFQTSLTRSSIVSKPVIVELTKQKAESTA